MTPAEQAQMDQTIAQLPDVPPPTLDQVRADRSGDGADLPEVQP